MTSNHKKIITVALFCVIPLLVFSQGPGGPGGGGPGGQPGAPISEGLIYLLISGIVYGFRKKIRK